jgi:hypothetical protein
MADDAIALFLAEVGSVAPAPVDPTLPTAAEIAALVEPAPIVPSEVDGLVSTRTATEVLDELAEAEDRLVAMRLTLEAELDSILTAEQRARIAAVRAAWDPRIAEANDAAAALREAAIEIVKARAESVKGRRLHAVYAAGRVSWDDRALLGYAKTRPEILDLRKTGAPTVSIRTIK